MAISQTPESAGDPSTTNWDLIRRSYVRRRPSVGGLFDDSSVQPESPVDSAAAKSGEEEEKHHRKLDGDGVNANGEQQQQQQRVIDASTLKFIYRPSVPAHRKVKESPLSSDNIFQQVVAVKFSLYFVS